MVVIEPAGEPAQDELRFVYRENGRCEGSAAGRPEGDTLVLTELSAQQPAAADGLVRALLNAALLRGLHTAVCGDAALSEALTEIGFSESGGELRLSIPEFFARPCRGSGEKTCAF